MCVATAPRDQTSLHKASTGLVAACRWRKGRGPVPQWRQPPPLHSAVLVPRGAHEASAVVRPLWRPFCVVLQTPPATCLCWHRNRPCSLHLSRSRVAQHGKVHSSSHSRICVRRWRITFLYERKLVHVLFFPILLASDSWFIMGSSISPSRSRRTWWDISLESFHRQGSDSCTSKPKTSSGLIFCHTRCICFRCNLFHHNCTLSLDIPLSDYVAPTVLLSVTIRW